MTFRPASLPLPLWSSTESKTKAGAKNYVETKTIRRGSETKTKKIKIYQYLLSRTLHSKKNLQILNQEPFLLTNLSIWLFLKTKRGGLMAPSSHQRGGHQTPDGHRATSNTSMLNKFGTRLATQRRLDEYQLPVNNLTTPLKYSQIEKMKIKEERLKSFFPYRKSFLCYWLLPFMGFVFLLTKASAVDSNARIAGHGSNKMEPVVLTTDTSIKQLTVGDSSFSTATNAATENIDLGTRLRFGQRPKTTSKTISYLHPSIPSSSFTFFKSIGFEASPSMAGGSKAAPGQRRGGHRTPAIEGIDGIQDIHQETQHKSAFGPQLSLVQKWYSKVRPTSSFPISVPEGNGDGKGATKLFNRQQQYDSSYTLNSFFITDSNFSETTKMQTDLTFKSVKQHCMLYLQSLEKYVIQTENRDIKKVSEGSRQVLGQGQGKGSNLDSYSSIFNNYVLSSAPGQRESRRENIKLKSFWLTPLYSETESICSFKSKSVYTKLLNECRINLLEKLLPTGTSRDAKYYKQFKDSQVYKGIFSLSLWQRSKKNLSLYLQLEKLKNLQALFLPYEFKNSSNFFKFNLIESPISSFRKTSFLFESFSKKELCFGLNKKKNTPLENFSPLRGPGTAFEPPTYQGMALEPSAILAFTDVKAKYNNFIESSLSTPSFFTETKTKNFFLLKEWPTLFNKKWLYTNKYQALNLHKQKEKVSKEKLFKLLFYSLNKTFNIKVNISSDTKANQLAASSEFVRPSFGIRLATQRRPAVQSETVSSPSMARGSMATPSASVFAFVFDEGQRLRGDDHRAPGLRGGQMKERKTKNQHKTKNVNMSYPILLTSHTFLSDKAQMSFPDFNSNSPNKVPEIGVKNIKNTKVINVDFALDKQISSNNTENILISPMPLDGQGFNGHPFCFAAPSTGRPSSSSVEKKKTRLFINKDKSPNSFWYYSTFVKNYTSKIKKFLLGSRQATQPVFAESQAKLLDFVRGSDKIHRQRFIKKLKKYEHSRNTLYSYPITSSVSNTISNTSTRVKPGIYNIEANLNSKQVNPYNLIDITLKPKIKIKIKKKSKKTEKLLKSFFSIKKKSLVKLLPTPYLSLNMYKRKSNFYKRTKENLNSVFILSKNLGFAKGEARSKAEGQSVVGPRQIIEGFDGHPLVGAAKQRGFDGHPGPSTGRPTSPWPSKGRKTKKNIEPFYNSFFSLNQRNSEYTPRLLIQNRSFILFDFKSSLNISTKATSSPIIGNSPTTETTHLPEVAVESQLEAEISKQSNLAYGIERKLSWNDSLEKFDGYPHSDMEQKRQPSKGRLTSSTQDIIIEKQRKSIQKKRRRKKLKKETRRRKKRKRFYPRPVWLRYEFFFKFLKKRFYSFKNSIHQDLRSPRSYSPSLWQKVTIEPEFIFKSPNEDYKTRTSDKWALERRSERSFSNLTQMKTWAQQRSETPLASIKKVPLITEVDKNVLSLHIKSKENFIIAHSVVQDFKRLLWKSYWLRANLNPYLNKVKTFLTEIKESTQQWELFTNLKAFFNFLGGHRAPSSTEFVKTLSHKIETAKEGVPLYILPTRSSKAALNNKLNKWESTLYFAEYNRLTYFRIQEFLSQIRENFSILYNSSASNVNTKNLTFGTDSNFDFERGSERKLKAKVRASHISHEKMQENKRLAALREHDIISKRKTTDFWVNLGKAIMSENQSDSFNANRGQQTYFKNNKEWWLFAGQDYINEPTTPQLRMLWALSKTTPSLFLEGSYSTTPSFSSSFGVSATNRDSNKSQKNLGSYLYKRKQTWLASPDASKIREQTKYNRTKKMVRNLTKKLQTLLNEQYDFAPLLKDTVSMPFFRSASLFPFSEGMGARGPLMALEAIEGVANETNKENLALKQEKTKKEKVRLSLSSEKEAFNNALLKNALKKIRQKESKSQFLNQKGNIGPLLAQKRNLGFNFIFPTLQNSSSRDFAQYKSREQFLGPSKGRRPGTYINSIKGGQTLKRLKNKVNDYAPENLLLLHEYKKQIQMNKPLFESSSLRWPGARRPGAAIEPEYLTRTKNSNLSQLKAETWLNNLTTKSSYWFSFSSSSYGGYSFPAGDQPSGMGFSFKPISQQKATLVPYHQLLFPSIFPSIEDSHLQYINKKSSYLDFVDILVNEGKENANVNANANVNENLLKQQFLTLSSSEKTVHVGKKMRVIEWFQILWISSLLFHFCSLLSLLSISQTRDLLKFYLLGMSKLYKTSFKILTISFNSLIRFKKSSSLNSNIHSSFGWSLSPTSRVGLTWNKKNKKTEPRIRLGFDGFEASPSQAGGGHRTPAIDGHPFDGQGWPSTGWPSKVQRSSVLHAAVESQARTEKNLIIALKLLGFGPGPFVGQRFDGHPPGLQGTTPGAGGMAIEAIEPRELLFFIKDGVRSKTNLTNLNYSRKNQVIAKFVRTFLKKAILLSKSSLAYLKPPFAIHAESLDERHRGPRWPGWPRSQVSKNTSKNTSVVKTYTILSSLIFLNFLFSKSFSVYSKTQKFFKQTFDLLGRFGPKSLFNFLEKPGELIIDWIAYLFLVEWASDVVNIIPENVDFYLGNSYNKTTRTIYSLNLLVNSSIVSFYNPTSSVDFPLIHSKIYTSEIETVNFSILNLASTFFKHRLFHLYEILLFQFYQPDTDLIVRQKKGVLFWDIWGDFLMQVAEDSNINISELTSLKEEQIKLFEKSSEILNSKSFKVFSPRSENLHPAKQGLPTSAFTRGEGQRPSKFFKIRKKQSLSSIQTFNSFLFLPLDSTNTNTNSKPFFSPLIKERKTNSFRAPVFKSSFENLTRTSGKDLNDKKNKETLGKRKGNVQKNENQGIYNQNFAAQQFLSYQGKDTELFIDLHPPKSFTMISLLKNNESVQTSIGPLVCQIFAGMISKQTSKNILIVGSSTQSFSDHSNLKELSSYDSAKNANTVLHKQNLKKQKVDLPLGRFRDNGLIQQEKTLLIQAIAGETELKIITDNAYRYAMVYRGVAVGIKLLRDVFDSLSLHTPCLFLIEDIHAIGERRPLLISDDEKGTSPNGKTTFGSQQEEIHEKNQVLYQLSKHVMTHYRKPYKGDFSLLIPTNHFCFDLFRTQRNPFSSLRGPNRIDPSSISFTSSKIPVQSSKPSSSTQAETEEFQNSTKSFNESSSFIDDVFTSLSSKSDGSISAQGTQGSSLTIEGGGNLVSQGNVVESNETKKSRLLIKSSQLFSPPATSPFSILNLKEEKKFKPYKLVSEMPWGGLPGEQLAQVFKASYSIRVKVAMLADMAISTLSVKLDMITDLLVIIDSVKANRGFVVFATTHVPYILDPALRRPGRLDETITLGLFPNLLSRWDILKSSFSLFTAGKEQTGFKKGISLDLTYSIDSFSLNHLNITPLTKNSLFKSSSFRFPSGMELHRFPLSFGLSSYFDSNVSKTSKANKADLQYKKETQNDLNLNLYSTQKVVSHSITESDSESELINTTLKKAEKFKKYKKRYLYKILSQTYFNASHMLYTANKNSIFSIHRKGLMTTREETGESSLKFVSNKLQKESLIKISNEKIKKTSMARGSMTTPGHRGGGHRASFGQNFIDSLQPSNMETSSLYINLYSSPLQFKNYIIKLMAGKIGEMFILSSSVPVSQSFFSKQGFKASHSTTILTNRFLPSSSPQAKTYTLENFKKIQKQENTQKSIQWNASFPTSFGLSSTWNLLSSLILSFVQKRSLIMNNTQFNLPYNTNSLNNNSKNSYSQWANSNIESLDSSSGFTVGQNSFGNKNLTAAAPPWPSSSPRAKTVATTNLLFFNNNNSLYEPPSPPSSNILLPARRYENYRRSFAYFSGRKVSIGIMEKIQAHQQQRLVKKLYGVPVKSTFRSEIVENRFSTFKASLSNKGSFSQSSLNGQPFDNQEWSSNLNSGNFKDLSSNQYAVKSRLVSFTNANLMIGSLSSVLQKPSNSNWFFKNQILMRHKNYLTNQWWNGQLPEHNSETTFLSDIDWRYSFVESIGDLLLDFPDADQHYNPRNRRWMLTKGEYHHWFNFEKFFYSEIYTHFIFDSFIQAFHLFEENREVLDFYAFYILRKGLKNVVNEYETIKLYKRFFN